MNTELKTSLIAAVVSAAVGGVAALGVQFLGDSVSQKRAARIETVLNFSNEELPITHLAARYISIITDGGDLGPLRLEIRGKVAEEIRKADRLKSQFANVAPAVTEYQDALETFAGSLDQAEGLTSMRAWVESFGRVVDARDVLDQQLRADVGV